ncbi:MAG TPA: GNAT family N-acetyltransferase [Tepidisphaeraceae bacterium]|jgi:GNAT superfamily N-acetyltransferase|nr:GNAT family N-acetyltransferase [Tepidisphaeraceae bacterium]
MAEIMVAGVVVRIAPAKLADILGLRHVVLREGLPPEAAIFEGDEAATSHHFAAFADGKCVGCASFHFNQYEGKPAWQLRGMATDAAFRSGGIGAHLLRVAEETVRNVGPVRQLWCNARTPALNFYKKQGWKIVSKEFFIPTAGPHFRMIKTLT